MSSQPPPTKNKGYQLRSTKLAQRRAAKQVLPWADPGREGGEGGQTSRVRLYITMCVARAQGHGARARASGVRQLVADGSAHPGDLSGGGAERCVGTHWHHPRRHDLLDGQYGAHAVGRVAARAEALAGQVGQARLELVDPNGRRKQLIERRQPGREAGEMAREGLAEERRSRRPGRTREARTTPPRLRRRQSFGGDQPRRPRR